MDTGFIEACDVLLRVMKLDVPADSGLGDIKVREGVAEAF